MTTIAVLVDPPREGVVLTRLAAATPISTAEAADLYAAMARDVLRAVAESGGDLLVNYRPDDSLDVSGDRSAEAAVRALAAGALEDPDEARFEVQVGTTFAARAGNTVAHLLEEEDADSVAIVEPTAAFLTRATIDSAAMKLRRDEAVLGPASRGRVYYAGFTDPVDFRDAYAAPAVGTLTDRAREAGHGVSYLPMLPTVETRADLLTAIPLIEARRRAGRSVPGSTAEYIDDLGLAVVAEDGEPTLVRETDRS